MPRRIDTFSYIVREVEVMARTAVHGLHTIPLLI